MEIFERIHMAAQRIGSDLIQTPVQLSYRLSEFTGASVYLKNEHLQLTGSFKVRGALNKIRGLTSEEKRRGVIAASTGNHGLGVCYAAQLEGVPATIYVPEGASPKKLKGIHDLHGKVVSVSGDCLTAETLARVAAAENNQVFISPYNDSDVIAGQGTIGLELMQQVSDLDAVFMSVGGGGLISGIGSYLKNFNPKVRVIGCWPKNSAALYQSLEAGKIISVQEWPTLSDGTAGGVEENSVTFPICQQVIDEKVMVSENEILAAIRKVAESESWLIEGAAGVALASLIQTKDQWRGKNVAVILCGRNLDSTRLNEIFGANCERDDSEL